jgi:preprotein translocase subunit SecA
MLFSQELNVFVAILVAAIAAAIFSAIWIWGSEKAQQIRLANPSITYTVEHFATQAVQAAEQAFGVNGPDVIKDMYQSKRLYAIHLVQQALEAENIMGVDVGLIAGYIELACYNEFKDLTE